MEAYESPAHRCFQVVIEFNKALNARDLDAMMRLMSQNCVFENTSPPPDGTRYEGQAAVRAFWMDFFSRSQVATIEIEEIFAAADRCVMRWKYQWVDRENQAGYIRGIDVYRLEDDLIVEKLSYVKG